MQPNVQYDQASRKSDDEYEGMFAANPDLEISYNLQEPEPFLGKMYWVLPNESTKRIPSAGNDAGSRRKRNSRLHMTYKTHKTIPGLTRLGISFKGVPRGVTLVHIVRSIGGRRS
eukprot:TRINITY_DN20341_c0_g1_i1.p2 TRINITY_DN20341_c0_g1~~TRINITY_DN20341_c0_g1_i1.p2  ORF type:complete len:115 (+),score=4.88 TRINITY_DN20341_c0_g1_i1:164-508(+)